MTMSIYKGFLISTEGIEFFRSILKFKYHPGASLFESRATVNQLFTKRKTEQGRCAGSQRFVFGMTYHVRYRASLMAGLLPGCIEALHYQIWRCCTIRA